MQYIYTYPVCERYAIYFYVCVYTHTHTHNIFMYAIYICMHTRTHKHIYIYMALTCSHTHKCIYVYIYTYISYDFYIYIMFFAFYKCIYDNWCMYIFAWKLDCMKIGFLHIMYLHLKDLDVYKPAYVLHIFHSFGRGQVLLKSYDRTSYSRFFLFPHPSSCYLHFLVPF